MNRQDIIEGISENNGKWEPTPGISFTQDTEDKVIQVKVETPKGFIVTGFLVASKMGLDFYISSGHNLTTWFDTTSAVAKLAKFLEVDMGTDPLWVSQTPEEPVEIPEERPTRADPKDAPQAEAFDPDKEFFRGRAGALSEVVDKLLGRGKITLE